MLNSKIRNIAQKITATATLGLPLLALSAIVAPLNALNGMPTFFRQTRYGKDGQEFKIWKFQTMKDGDAPDHERVTTVGKILRKTSLDELPQLLNVWNGDMDLVGYRPLKNKRQDHWKNISFPPASAIDTSKITPEMTEFNTVKQNLDALEQIKPGIFGAVQISQYRGEYDTKDKTSFKNLCALEDTYLQQRKTGHLSALWQDAVILAKVPHALISKPGHVARNNEDEATPQAPLPPAPEQ